MEAQEIHNRLLNIIRPYAKAGTAVINDETRLIEDLGVNSPRLVDISLAIEDDFDIEMPDGELEKLQNVGNIIQFIQNSE